MLQHLICWLLQIWHSKFLISLDMETFHVPCWTVLSDNDTKHRAQVCGVNISTHETSGLTGCCWSLSWLHLCVIYPSTLYINIITVISVEFGCTMYTTMPHTAKLKILPQHLLHLWALLVLLILLCLIINSVYNTLLASDQTMEPISADSRFIFPHTLNSISPEFVQHILSYMFTRCYVILLECTCREFRTVHTAQRLPQTVPVPQKQPAIHLPSLTEAPSQKLLGLFVRTTFLFPFSPHQWFVQVMAQSFAEALRAWWCCSLQVVGSVANPSRSMTH